MKFRVDENHRAANECQGNDGKQEKSKLGSE